MSSIEDSIVAAAEVSEEAREKFYKDLLLTRLHFPVKSEIPAGAKQFTIPGKPPFTWAVSVMNGRPTVPVFTSKEKMSQFFLEMDGWEDRSLEEQAPALMKNLIASDLTLSLNPLDQHGVSLSPTKMQDMLSGFVSN